MLDALDGARSRLGDIAERAQLPKSTVHRILRRLVERGYARAEGDGVYVLGPRVLTMAGAMLHRLDAARVAAPVLRELHGDLLDPWVAKALEHALDVAGLGVHGRNQLLVEQAAEEVVELRVGDGLGDGLVALGQPERGERGVARVQQPQLHQLVAA